MLRKQVNIDGNRFLVEYYNFNDDNINVYKQFSFLRRYTITNDIIYDTDIYIIDNSLLETVNNENTLNGYIDSIVFPIRNVKNVQYSNLYSNFNISSDNNIKHNIYGLYNYDIDTNTLNVANIKCDKIRIYHPDDHILHNKIIHIDALYNNITFNYYCNISDNITSKITNKEFKLTNKTYVEYIEIYIPNIESLFYFNNQYVYNENNDNKLTINRNPNNVYFLEDLNLISYDKTYNNIHIKDINKSLEENKDVYVDLKIGIDYIKHINQIYIPFNTMLEPFFINTLTNDEALKKYGINDTITIKEFSTNVKTIDNNYITTPINIKIADYTGDISDNYYSLNLNLYSSASFASAYRFTMEASLGFDNGICSIINKINYPNKEYMIKLYGDETTALSEAYKLYNNITGDAYKNRIYVTFDNSIEFLVYLTSGEPLYVKNIDNTEDNIIIEKYYLQKYKERIINKNVEYWVINDDDDWEYRIELNDYADFYCKKFKILDDYDDFDENDLANQTLLNESIKTTGFMLYLASDIHFNYIIYKRTANVNFIEDVTFNLNGIFNSWYNLPDVVIAKIIFIDRIIGRAISSNTLVITKEWYKYLVNSLDDKYRLNLTNLTVIDNKLNIKKENDGIFDITSKTINIKQNNLNENMDLTYINFIDKVSCIINKIDTSTITNSSNNVKMIYKPIFYRTYDLQKIRLKSNITQNVGINLSEYMTKVTTFMINIDGKLYSEVGRNDIFVIFKLNNNLINGDSGIYTVVNQDGEYISDGQWEKY